MKKLTLEKVIPWLLIVCGTIGLAMAAIITIEKIHLLEHPNAQFICDINPIISCGSVMQSKQSNAFGFPNPLIGIAAYPVLIVSGVVLLQKLRLKRWYWLGLQIGTAFGAAFCLWLFYQTVYRIGALCPYCIVTWIATITAFWYILQYNLKVGHILTPGRLVGVVGWLRNHHLDILVLWFLIMFGLILKHFWYYFGRNF